MEEKSFRVKSVNCCDKGTIQDLKANLAVQPLSILHCNQRHSVISARDNIFNITGINYHDSANNKSDLKLEADDITAEIDDVTANSANVTPNRRNKRKMAEPRRRTTDFSIRSLCDNCNSDDDNEEKDKISDRPARISSASVSTESEDNYNLVAGSDTIKIEKSPAALTLNETKIGSGSFAFGMPANFPNFMPLIYAGGSFSPLWLYGVHALPNSNIPPLLIPPQISPRPDFPVQLPALSTLPNVGSANLSNISSSSASSTVSSPKSHMGSVAPPPSHPPNCQQADSNPPSSPPPTPCSVGDDGSPEGSRGSRAARKNYKNMTKQRRIEANARERTRVHTISAAFESLRRAIPSYSHNQRLSKLAILRIACSYILALASLSELDYSDDQCPMSFDECVAMCSTTIQAEGKVKRRH